MVNRQYFQHRLASDADLPALKQLMELGATISGEKLYQAYGFEPMERVDAISQSGISFPIMRMRKEII